MVADAPARQETAPGLGLLPLFVFVASLGLLLVAIAGDGARSGAGYADPLFWLGIAVLVLPIAGRQFAASTSRRERIGLVIALGVGAYLVKVMNSPIRFSLHDEFGHVRTTMDILLSGHLYAHNPLVGTYGSYPGLEMVTAAVHQFTGLSVFDSGLVVIGVARLILAVGLFVLLEAVSRSSRIAGIATVVYAANPNFLFFGSIFAYESLAIPLALLAIALALRAAIVTERGAGLIIASGVLILALVPTHHVTSWGVVLTFGLLAGLSVLGQRQRFRLTAPPGSVRRYLPLALVALVAVVAWTALVGGTDTDNSLGPVAKNTYHGVADLITGSSGAKRPFQKTNGAPAETPLEQLTGIGSTLLILASLPVALWILRRRKRLSPIEALTVLAVLAYPFSLAIRLTAAGTETSNRASEFLFVGLGYAVALALTATRRDWTDLRRRPRVAKAFAVGAAAAYLAFLVIGGIIVGWPPYDRLPGTYEPAAGSRSVDPYTVSAARWAGANIPRKTTIVSDSVNGSLAVAQGLNPQRGKVNGAPVARLFFTRTLGPADRAIIRFDHIRYLIVDRRLHQSLPLQGRYFEGGDPAGFKLHGGIPLRALTKFEGAPGSSKVYDNGPVAIYDVSAIAMERTVIARLRIPLLLLVLLAAAGALRAFADSPALLTAAGVLLLAVPGFALSLAFAPGRELGGAFRVILALALSIAAVILSALVLDQIDRITPDGMSIALGAIGAVSAVAAFVVAPAPGDIPPLTLRGAGSWLLLAPAAAVAVGALLLSIHSASERDRGAQFAQLSMRAGGAGRVRLVLTGVGGERRYAVRLRAGNRTVASWRGVRLGGGGRWVRSAAVPPGAGRVNAVVSRAGDPRPDYRTADVEAGR